MIGNIRGLAAGLMLAGAAAPVAAAQGAGDIVSASEPAGLVLALMNAGYDAELTRDSTGDPMIRVTTEGYPINLIFFGCSPETNDGCDSLQFVTGLDRPDAWSAEAALKITREYRFIAVQLDNEGDPFFTWDVVTGRSGIPSAVFIESVARFENAVSLAAEMVFAN
ncbi:MAG: YbjN domain-containing protein [Erythrobacter sp.]